MNKRQFKRQNQAKEDQGPSMEVTGKEKAYVSGLLKMLHDKQTSGDIVGILKTAPPEQSVPQAALTVNQNFSDMAKEGGKPIPFDTALKGLVYLTQDLFAIGEAAGIFEMPEEQGAVIMEDTMSKFVHAGLKDKSIDPIELQQYGESLMSPEQKAMGLQAGQEAGVPQEAGTQQAMETYASQREQQAVNKMANQKASQNRQGMMQQASQQGGA